MSLGKSIDISAEYDTPTHHHTANVITTSIGGILSMVGALFIVISYIKLREVRTGAGKILLCISIADFLSACSSVIGVWVQSTGKSCKTEAFLIIFSSTASFFWTSCLAIHLFLVTVNNNDMSESRKRTFGFCTVSWGLPLFFSIVALGCGALGPSPSLSRSKMYIKLTTGGWCWIKQFKHKSDTIVWTLMTSKLWELASYLLIVVLCLLILRQLRFKVRKTYVTYKHPF